jgi:hypothetical protein
MIRKITHRPATEYLVDGLFTTRTVHLIIGPSGAGKTTWISQVIRDWRIGLPILGRASHPKPFGYISLDRGYDEYGDIWKKVGLVEDFPMYFMREQEGWWTGSARWKTIIQDIAQEHPDVKVWFLDGLTNITPDGKIIDYGVVAQFLLEMGAWCEHKNLTIMGLGHTTKLKEGSGIVQARECAIGSVAWAAYSSGLVKVMPTNPGDADCPLRTINLQPRGSAPQTIEYTFTDQGVLEMIVNPETPPVSSEEFTKAMQALEEFPLGEEFAIADLVEKWEGVPKTTRYRWLEKLVSKDIRAIEKVRHGIYRRPMIN